MLQPHPSDVGDRPWTVFTVMFFHDHVLHLALMLALLAVFGVALERTTGAGSVLAVYVACGVIGALAAVAASGVLDVDEPAVGSSAAVFGIMGAYTALRPAARVLGGRTTQWVGAILVANLVLAASMPLGTVAHVAGVGAGLVAGRLLRPVSLRAGPNPRSPA